MRGEYNQSVIFVESLTPTLSQGEREYWRAFFEFHQTARAGSTNQSRGLRAATVLCDNPAYRTFPIRRPWWIFPNCPTCTRS